MKKVRQLLWWLVFLATWGVAVQQFYEGNALSGIGAGVVAALIAGMMAVGKVLTNWAMENGYGERAIESIKKEARAEGYREGLKEGLRQ